ncbi:MAG: hypothetical protein ACXVPU_02845 [Bacteroidia bacterium]
MKFIGLFFILVATTACSHYKVTHWNYDIPLSKYSNINNSSKRLKSFEDLPKRIKNIPEFKNQAVTADSIYFNNSPQTTSLFLYGVYDKKEKVGYVVQRFLTGEKKLANQCTLFIIRGDSLTFNFSSASKNVFTWTDIKSHIDSTRAYAKENNLIFGGGITVLKNKNKK